MDNVMLLGVFLLKGFLVVGLANFCVIMLIISVGQLIHRDPGDSVTENLVMALWAGALWPYFWWRRIYEYFHPDEIDDDDN